MTKKHPISSEFLTKDILDRIEQTGKCIFQNYEEIGRKYCFFIVDPDCGHYTNKLLGCDTKREYRECGL
jgi:hypothetical protein